MHAIESKHTPVQDLFASDQSLAESVMLHGGDLSDEDSDCGLIGLD